MKVVPKDKFKFGGERVKPIKRLYFVKISYRVLAHRKIEVLVMMNMCMKFNKIYLDKKEVTANVQIRMNTTP